MSDLFTEATMGSLTLTNRIMVAPMCQYSGVNGGIQPWHEQHIGHLACSGAGALTMEATAVEPSGMITHGCLGLWNQDQEDALSGLISRIRTYSTTPIGVQLNHAGRKASALPPWEGGRPLSKENGWTCYAPSPIPWGEGWPDPMELTPKRMNDILEAFTDSARRAENAGFDYIELHAAHGYLLHSFLSPVSNRRQDEFGGSLENRMRYPLMVVRSVSEAVSKNTTFGIRINGSDWLEDGWTLDDAITFAKQLEAIGVDYVSVSSGGACGGVNYPKKEAYQVELASQVRSKLQIPVVCAGLLNDPSRVNRIVEDGQADFIALARAFLNNPKWPKHAAQELGDSLPLPRQHWAVSPETWPFLNGTLG